MQGQDGNSRADEGGQARCGDGGASGQRRRLSVRAATPRDARGNGLLGPAGGQVDAHDATHILVFDRSSARNARSTWRTGSRLSASGSRRTALPMARRPCRGRRGPGRTAVRSVGRRSPRTIRETVETFTPDRCASWRSDIRRARSWSVSQSRNWTSLPSSIKIRRLSGHAGRLPLGGRLRPDHRLMRRAVASGQRACGTGLRPCVSHCRLGRAKHTASPVGRGQRAQALGEPQVLAVVDRDLDERRARADRAPASGSGTSSAAVVGRNAGDPERSRRSATKSGFPNSTPNGRPNSLRCFQSISP